MAIDTRIEWATDTFNGWWGCEKVSPLCDHCYAEGTDKRHGGDHWGPDQPRRYIKGVWKDPLKWNAIALATGERRRIFCGSMKDIFEKSRAMVDLQGNLLNFETGDVRRRIFEELVPATPMCDWLFLTKRIGNVLKMVPAAWLQPGGWPPNAWIMGSVGMQLEADRDIIKLLDIPAPVLGLSMEPLLRGVSLRHVRPTRGAGLARSTPELDALGVGVFDRKVDWVIAGGESGHHARPMHPAWARQLRDECAETGTPFLFKQWGEWAPCAKEDWHGMGPEGSPRQLAVSLTGETCGGFLSGADEREAEGWTPMSHLGKKNAGRLLDGREHNGLPTPDFSRTLHYASR